VVILVGELQQLIDDLHKCRGDSHFTVYFGMLDITIEEVSHADVLSGEELKGRVRTSREHGEIEHGKADMLHNLFEFDQRNVGRVMLPRGSMKVLDVSGPPKDKLAIIRDSGHSRYPVIDSSADEVVLAIVLAKDLHTAVLRGESEPWRNLPGFCRDPLMVPESGDVIIESEFRLTVESLQDNRVGEVLIEYHSEDSGEESQQQTP